MTNTTQQPTAAEELETLIERIERLEEEKKGLSSDIRDIFTEAKDRGYDVKAMRNILRLRKMDDEERERLEDMTDAYKVALKMVPDLREEDDRLEQSA